MSTLQECDNVVPSVAITDSKVAHTFRNNPQYDAQDVIDSDLVDVIITDKPSNSVSKNRSQVCYLHSIMGVLTKELSVDTIRKFMTKVGIGRSRNLTKIQVIEKLVLRIKNPKKFVETYGLLSAGSTAVSRLIKPVRINVKINRTRYTNILFCDLVRPLLADKGRPLSSRVLTAGKKTDQGIHEVIAEEYNKVEIFIYNQNSFLKNPVNNTGDKRLLMLERFNTDITWQICNRYFSRLCSLCSF